ncbi:MAG TPA: YicC/YloC family endoribonuclease, partial [Polyangiaceae bacterium]|nr:YicC/YloC family endoribonuclease [Polyangiaceae bacterium]
MLSMTGFGAGSAEGPHGAVIAEARSVNARTLDVRCRLPEALGDTSLWAEQLVRGRIRRGRVEIVVRSTGPSAVGVEIDRARARSAIG